MSEVSFTIAICDRCGDMARPGERLYAKLTEIADVDRFRVEKVSCLAGCGRPLAVAFMTPGKASYLFGEIDPEADIDALRSFGTLYRTLPDGWSRESERPAGLRGKTLARIPFIPPERGMLR